MIEEDSQHSIELDSDSESVSLVEEDVQLNGQLDDEFVGEDGQEITQFSDEEMDETKEETYIPVEWACAYCQNDDPTAVAQCMICKKWFCNSYQRGGSHIVKHLVLSEHKTIRLHPEGLHKQLGDVVVCCTNDCTHNNIFNLGTCYSDMGYVAIICRDQCLDKSGLKELSWNADTWEHVIKDKHIVPLLLNDAPADDRNVIPISEEEIRLLENSWKTNQMATLNDIYAGDEGFEDRFEEVPLSFGTAMNYDAIFSPMINGEELSDRADNDLKCIDNVTIRWEAGINNTRIAVFHNSTFDSRYRMNLGQSLEFHLPLAILNNEEMTFSGKVIHMKDTEIKVQFSQEESLPLGQTSGYNVTFCWNPTTFTRMKAAIASLYNSSCMSPHIYNYIMGNKVESVPFPLPPLQSLSVKGFPELNNSQVEAVRAALSSELTLIQGPPGTGKTITSATIVYHLVKSFKERVLVTAPSNIAVDNLTLRIHKLGLNVVRVVARSRESVSSSVERNCLHNMAVYVGGESSELNTLNCELQRTGQLDTKKMSIYQKLLGIAENAILENAEVVCCTCVGSRDNRLLPYTFPNVLVDESTQAREPECLIPIVNGCRRLIMVGDHEQLGPVILNQAAKCAGFDTSMFERLLSLDVIPHRLNVQYRMHPALSEFSSNTFYNGELQNGVNVAERTRNIDFPWPRSDKPMMFWAVQGAEEIGATGKSQQNRMEAKCVEMVVSRLLSSGIDGDRIGVVTPYASQRSLLSLTLLRHSTLESEKYEAVEVASVDEFQGREKDYIVFSCVRSNGNGEIGFLSDYRRLNVALTRAKYGIVIIGNPSTLKNDSLWRSLLVFYQDRKCLVSGATLDNLSNYMVRLPSVDFEFTGRQYRLAKKHLKYTGGYTGPDSSAFFGLSNMDNLQKGGDVFSTVHSSFIEVSNPFGTSDSIIDYGDTGI